MLQHWDTITHDYQVSKCHGRNTVTEYIIDMKRKKFIIFLKSPKVNFTKELATCVIS